MNLGYAHNVGTSGSILKMNGLTQNPANYVRSKAMYKEIETIIQLVRSEQNLSNEIRWTKEDHPNRVEGLERAKHLLQQRMLDQCRFICGIDWRSKQNLDDY